MKKTFPLFAVSCLTATVFVVGTAGLTYAVSTKCIDGLGFDCRVDQGDILFGGVDTNPPNPGGLDNEENVEAAIQSANGGTFIDLTLLGKSDEGYGDPVNGASGTWSIPDFAAFITVKAANSFNMFEINPASTTGNWDTLDLLNNGGQQADVSHISYWGADDDGGVIPSGEVPEPSTVLLLGSGLVGLGLWKWRLFAKV